LKNGLFFGTWNVRAIFKPGAVRNIIKEIEKYKLKIVALLIIRWDDTGMLDIQENIINTFMGHTLMLTQMNEKNVKMMNCNLFFSDQIF